MKIKRSQLLELKIAVLESQQDWSDFRSYREVLAMVNDLLGEGDER